MNVHTNHQVIKNKQGEPEYVVIPYEDYLELTNKSKINQEQGVPSEVVDLIFDKNYSAARAWREYLGLTQAQAASKLNISQSAYSQLESTSRPSKKTRLKISKALNLNPEQLDL